MKDKIGRWLLMGKTGISSKAMARAVLGECQEWTCHNHPCDPDDLNRCLILVADVPEMRDHFHKIAALSTVWARLIDNWDRLETCFVDEVGVDWCKAKSAPKTYAAMKVLGC